MKPFHLYENKVVLEVELDGRKVKAVVDTGANLCLVKEGLLEVSEGAGTTQLSGAFGQTTVPLVEVLDLTLLGRKFQRPQCAVATVAMFESMPPDVEFIVSNQVLEDQCLTLDFRFGTVSLDDPPQTLVTQDFELTRHRGVHFFDTEFAGRSVSCLFDLGAALNVLNSRSSRVTVDDLLPIGSMPISDTGGTLRDQPLYGYEGHNPLPPLWGQFIGTAVDLSPLEKALGRPIDFILGLSSMLSSQQVWRVDNRRHRLTLSRGLRG